MKKIILVLLLICNFLYGNDIDIDELEYKNNRFYLKNSDETFTGKAVRNTEDRIEEYEIEDGINISEKRYRRKGKILLSQLSFDKRKNYVKKEKFSSNGSYTVYEINLNSLSDKSFYKNKKLDKDIMYKNLDLDKEELIAYVNYGQSLNIKKFKYQFEKSFYDLDGNLYFYNKKDVKTGNEILILDGMKKEILNGIEKVYYENGELNMVNRKSYNDKGIMLEKGNFSELKSIAMKDINSGELLYNYDKELPIKESGKEKIVSSYEKDFSKEGFPFLKGKVVKKEKRLQVENSKLFYEVEEFEGEFPIEIVKNSDTPADSSNIEILKLNKIKMYSEEKVLEYTKDYKVEGDKLVFIKNKYYENGKILRSLKEEYNLKELERAVEITKRNSVLNNSPKLELPIIDVTYMIEEFDKNGNLKYSGVYSKDKVVEKYFFNEKLLNSLEEKIVGDTIKREEKFYFLNGKTREYDYKYLVSGKIYEYVSRDYDPQGILISDKSKNGDMLEQKEYYDNGKLKRYLKNENEDSYLYEGYYRNEVTRFREVSASYRKRHSYEFNSDGMLIGKEYIYYDDNWKAIRREKY